MQAAALMAAVLIVSLLTGCGSENSKKEEDQLMVYLVNTDDTALIEQPYRVEADMDDPDLMIAEFIKALEKKSQKLEYEAPISGSFHLISYTFVDGLLTLNFDSKYMNTNHIDEILHRAAIVRTLTQVEGVDNVVFNIEGNPLTDPNGNIVGNMSADTFIYNAGKEINTYEKVELTLYFSNAEGNSLNRVYRSVVYNSNISLERLIMEQLIAGPNNELASPTISSATKVNSVSVKDGVCYVDLSSGFMDNSYNVDAEVAVYSIVDSLVELSNVNRVQLSIDGKTDVKLKNVDLKTPFTRNLDILEN